MTRGRVYLWLQALVCILLAVFLSLSAVQTFREGSARKAEHPMENIYRPEDVSRKLAQAAPLFFTGVGLLIAGIVLGVKEEDAGRPGKENSLRRDYLRARVAHPSKDMLSEQGIQRKLACAGWGLFALCMVPVLVYLLHPAHFPQDDLEGMFFGLMRVVLPWTCAGLAALAVTSRFRERSVLREIQAARARWEEEKEAGLEAVSTPESPRRGKGMLQAAVIGAAVFLLIAGVCNQSARDVLYKAVTICTECVGLG